MIWSACLPAGQPASKKICLCAPLGPQQTNKCNLHCYVARFVGFQCTTSTEEAQMCPPKVSLLFKMVSITQLEQH